MEATGERLNNSPWHILGVGSVGGLFAARLTACAIPVTLFLRDDAALTRYHAANGLRVSGPGDAHMHAQPPAIAIANATVPDAILVTTKAQDTLTALAPLMLGDGNGQLVFLLQNGMGVSERVRARWPGVRLWNAVTTAGVWRASGFELHCVAEGETLCGRWDDAGSAAGDAHLDPLVAAGVMKTRNDIRAVLWRKLAVNACINALTAIYQCRNGELLTNSKAHARMAQLAAEVEHVAQAEGIRFDTPVLAMSEDVCRLTANNFSSMNRDVAAGRKTEIEFINGYVVACAQRHALVTAENSALIEEILRAAHPS